MRPSLPHVCVSLLFLMSSSLIACTGTENTQDLAQGEVAPGTERALIVRFRNVSGHNDARDRILTTISQAGAVVSERIPGHDHVALVTVPDRVMVTELSESLRRDDEVVFVDENVDVAIPELGADSSAVEGSLEQGGQSWPNDPYLSWGFADIHANFVRSVPFASAPT